MEIRKLNTLRGLAAFIVLVAHFSDATSWMDGSLGGRAGQYGVMLFFMLSGFLISYLYLGKAFSKDNIKKYLVARVARVLPLFFLVVVFSYICQILGFGFLFDISDPEKLLAHFIFTYGEGLLWSIAPEIHFYLIFLGVWLLSSRRAGYMHLLIVATLIVLFFTNFPRPHGEILDVPYDFHIFRSLPYFLVGLIFGRHYVSFVVPEYLKSNWYVFTLLLIPLMYPAFSPVTSDATYRMWLSFEVLFVFSTMFFSIVYLVPNNNFILSNRIGDFIGKISYSLYLLHMPVLWQINKLNINIELKFLLFILLSILVAYISYKLLELPLSKIIRSITANKSSKRDAVIDAST